jgi:hypothetical protein
MHLEDLGLGVKEVEDVQNFSLFKIYISPTHVQPVLWKTQPVKQPCP